MVDVLIEDLRKLCGSLGVVSQYQGQVADDVEIYVVED
jgi:hypothetical protein